MAFWNDLINFFTPSSDAPAVPLPDGTVTGQASAAQPAMQSTTKATQATKASQSRDTMKSRKATGAGKTKQTTKAQPETEALLNGTAAADTAQPQTKMSANAHQKATEQTIKTALKNFEDTFMVYNPDGSLNVQASIDEFNTQQAMGLLQEKARDMKDFNDKRNWDDALKMLANWAPQGPSVLFRGQGGNKIYQRK